MRALSSALGRVVAVAWLCGCGAPQPADDYIIGVTPAPPREPASLDAPAPPAAPTAAAAPGRSANHGDGYQRATGGSTGSIVIQYGDGGAAEDESWAEGDAAEGEEYVDDGEEYVDDGEEYDDEAYESDSQDGGEYEDEGEYGNDGDPEGDSDYDSGDAEYEEKKASGG